MFGVFLKLYSFAFLKLKLNVIFFPNCSPTLYKGFSPYLSVPAGT